MGKPAAGESESHDLQRELGEFVQRFEGIMALDGFVDLDVVVGGEVTFRVTDVHGKKQEIVIPNDLPFPTAAGFLNAWDLWYKAWEAYTRSAGRPDERRRAQAYARAHEQLNKATLAIVRLRQPEVADDYFSSFGEGALRQWINTLYARLTAIRAGLGVRSEDDGGGEPPDPKAGGPKTSTGRRTSSRSSAGSDGRTPGATTTGARSAGRSSGTRSKKRPTRQRTKHR